jgi:septal ring factor EnvC (AmiA/AmiB activator)
MKVGDIYVSNVVIMSAVTIVAIICLIMSHIKRNQIKNDLKTAETDLQLAQGEITKLTGDLATATEKLNSLGQNLNKAQENNKTADQASSWGFGSITICAFVVGIPLLIAFAIFRKNPTQQFGQENLIQQIKANQQIEAQAAQNYIKAQEQKLSKLSHVNEHLKATLDTMNKAAAAEASGVTSPTAASRYSGVLKSLANYSRRVLQDVTRYEEPNAAS